jgi:hypothetical protein
MDLTFRFQLNRYLNSGLPEDAIDLANTVARMHAGESSLPTVWVVQLEDEYGYMYSEDEQLRVFLSKSAAYNYAALLLQRLIDSQIDAGCFEDYFTEFQQAVASGNSEEAVGIYMHENISDPEAYQVKVSEEIIR